MFLRKRKSRIGMHWLRKKIGMRKMSNKGTVRRSSIDEKKLSQYQVVLKFVEPASEEERIERQYRVAKVMIRYAIALAKKDNSIIDKDKLSI